MIPCSPPNHEPFFRTLDTERLHSILDNANQTSGMMENPMLLICITGNITISIDQREYRLTPHHVCSLYPYSCISIENYSDDYTGFYFEVPLTMYRRVHAQLGTPLTAQVRSTPCIEVSEEFKMRMGYFRNLFASYSDSPLEHSRKDSLFHLTMTVIYEISNLYQKAFKANSNVRPTRQDSIFHQFLVLLAHNYLTHRDVEYYANEMALTPRHLSRVVKQKTSHSCSHWIKEIAIIHIKRMLLENNNQVQDVCYAFHFPNPSFFAQYFKKETGITPREYQKKYE